MPEMAVLLGNGDIHQFPIDNYAFSQPVWMGGDRDNAEYALRQATEQLSRAFQAQKDAFFELCLGSAGLDTNELRRHRRGSIERDFFLRCNDVEITMRTDGLEEVKIKGQPVVLMSAPTVRIAEENSHVSRVYIDYQYAILPYRDRQPFDWEGALCTL